MWDSIWKGKRLFCILLLLLFSLSLCSSCTADFYAGSRPFDYPNSVWVCESPHITIVIGPQKQTKAFFGSQSDGEEFDLLFDFGTGTEAYKAGTTHISKESRYFMGQCIFSEKNFSIILTEDNLWDGKYKKLCFDRIK